MPLLQALAQHEAHITSGGNGPTQQADHLVALGENRPGASLEVVPAREHLYAADPPANDESNRLRLDDRELRDEVQQACRDLWPTVTTENLFEVTDYATYKQDFLKLFGFERDDVDYDADVDPVTPFDVVDLTAE